MTAKELYDRMTEARLAAASMGGDLDAVGLEEIQRCLDELVVHERQRLFRIRRLHSDEHPLYYCTRCTATVPMLPVELKDTAETGRS